MQRKLHQETWDRVKYTAADRSAHRAQFGDARVLSAYRKGHTVAITAVRTSADWWHTRA